MTNILINAGPGCGKTTTLAESYLYHRHTIKSTWLNRYNSTQQQLDIYEAIYKQFPHITSPPIYMAYNKDIVDDISKKVHGDCKVLTIHGWGYKLLREKYGNILINPNKNEILISKLEGKDFRDLSNKWQWVATARYVEKMKDELLPISDETFTILRNKYEDLGQFKIHDNMKEQAERLIIASKDPSRTIGITYSDQVWLALFILAQTGPKYEWGMCDEAQDLSPARLTLAQNLCKHVIFCGDKNQAINAWSGADPYSMDKIQEVCQLTFPLTTSFRLPPNHAAYANTLKTGTTLTSVPGKPDGRFEKIEGEQILDWGKEFVSKDTMVVCRYNAPLVKFGLNMIKVGVPVSTTGNTLKETLISIVKNRNAGSLTELEDKLQKYESVCMMGGDEFTKAMIKDKFDCIRYILNGCDSINEYYRRVDQLTTPPKKSDYIKLSTVHRAKGLERTTIGILNPPIQSSKAKTDVQKLQEENVNYVAHTRSRRDMFYLCS